MIGSNVRAGIVLDATDNTGAAFTSLQQRLATAKVKLGEVGETAAALPARFGAIGVALGAALAGASLKGAIDIGDQIDEVSEKSGVATRTLSELRYAGEVAGTPFEALGDGMRKLAVNMAAAASGSKEQAEAFRQLGISVRGADGALKGSDEMLAELADRFAGFSDGPEKAALAVKLFGKSGEQMIPVLSLGSAGIRDLREEADRLGASIGEEAARSFAAFNDNLKRVELAAVGAKSAIAAELVPTLNTITEAFLESRTGGEAFSEFIGGTLRTALEAGSVMLANVSFVLKGIGRELGAWAAQFGALMSGNLAGFSAISDAVKEDGIRARRELDQLEARILTSGRSTAGAGRGTISDPRVLGPVGTIREQAKGILGRAPLVGDGATVEDKDNPYDRLNKSLQERLSLMGAEIAAGRELTDVEKLEVKTLADLALAKGKITAAQRETILAELEGVKAMQLARDIQRSELAQAKELATQRQKLRNADNDSVGAWLREQEQAAQARVAAIRERTQSIEDELQAMQLATEQNISLAEAVELVAIARARERLERLNDDGDEAARVRAEIEERERLLLMLGKQRVTQEFQRDWQRLADDIYSGLTDSLYRAFESGGRFFSTFWSGIKNTIKTTVLRIAIQAVLGTGGTTGIIGQVLGAAAGGGGAGGAGATIGSLGSIASLATGISSFGGFAATGFMNTIAGGAGLIGNIGNGISAATSLISGGSVSSGLGMLAGTLGPIVAGIALVASLAKSFKGETRAGGQYNFGTLVSGPSGGEIGGSGVAAQMAQVTAEAIDATLAKVGSAARLTNFFSGLESSGNGKGFVGAGGTLSTGQAFGEGWGAAFSQDLWANRRGNFTAEEAMVAFQDELLQATLQALQVATDVPETIRRELEGKNFNGMAKAELEAQLGVINQIVADVDRFRAAAQALPFERLAGLSFDLAAALGKAAGGMDNLLAGMQAFYSPDFFTTGELRQQTARNIQRVLAEAGASFSVQDILAAADLGEAGRQMWRATVEAFEQRVAQGDEAAAPLLASLYAMSSAFASIAPIAEAAAQTITDAFDAAAEAREKYLSELASAGGSIADYVRELTATRGGTATPLDQLAARRAQYLADLSAARQGDLAASQRVAGSAQDYVSAQIGYSASGPASQATIAQVLAELQGLPAFTSYEEQLVKQGLEQTQLLQAIKVNTGATVTTIAAGFQGPAGYVSNTPAAAPSSSGSGASFGGSATIAAPAPAPAGAASAGGAVFGGTATVRASIGDVLGRIDWSDPAYATASLAQSMRDNRWTTADVAGVYSWFTPTDIARHLKEAGFGDVVPGYAQGANVIPSTQLAILHPNEAVLPAPFNPWAGGALPLDDGGTREEVRALRADVSQVVERVDRLTAVVAAFARENVSQGAQIVDNTAVSRSAVLLEANKPTPVRGAGNWGAS